MRKWFVLLMLVIVTSCSFDDPTIRMDYHSTDQPQTRSVDQPVYIVTEEDLNDYFRFKSLLCKSYAETKSIMPIINDGEFIPSVYLVNYSDGWELISGDKRSPSVLMSGSGTFDYDKTENESLKYWIKKYCAEISDIQKCNELSPVQKEYTIFWESISYGRQKNDTDNQTRTVLPPHQPRYELIRVDTIAIEADSIPHLISTHWGQESPYNLFCPLKSDNSGQHAPAGCIAVAGAQMFNYWHEQMGYDVQVPDTASVTGHSIAPADMNYYLYCLDTNQPFNMPYFMRQWDFNYSPWNEIEAGNTNKISVLIANFGKLSNLIYFDNIAIGVLEDLSSQAFGFYDIPTTYGDYEEDIVADLLLEGDLPTIVGGQTSSAQNSIGHAFIIDRYKLEKVRYAFTYQSIDDETIQKKVIMYSEPYLKWFGMNWGYGGSGDDVWSVWSGPWCFGNNNYHHKIEMITFGEI